MPAWNLRGRYARLRERNGGRPGRDLPDDIDYFVYSSHKTGTQSISATLRHSGFRVRHAHRLSNVGMPADGEAFRGYLERYRRRKHRKLDVISVFRLPLERHMSSFFQWYGDGMVRNRLVAERDQTIIARYGVETLQEMFLEEIRNGSLIGRQDSLPELCGELGYDISSLAFDPAVGGGILEDDLVRVYLFRFDQLFPDSNEPLQKALGTRLRPKVANASADKWYARKYAEFTSSIVIPVELIEAVHEAKRDLIDVFFPSQFESIIAERIARYATARR